jgi:hypothetical protein
LSNTVVGIDYLAWVLVMLGWRQLLYELVDLILCSGWTQRAICLSFLEVHLFLLFSIDDDFDG